MGRDAMSFSGGAGSATQTWSFALTHPCPVCGSYDTVRSGDVLLCNVCAKREGE